MTDKLAVEWLKKHYNKDKLLKLCSYFKNQEWEEFGKRARKEDKKIKKYNK